MLSFYFMPKQKALMGLVLKAKKLSTCKQQDHCCDHTCIFESWSILFIYFFNIRRALKGFGRPGRHHLSQQDLGAPHDRSYTAATVTVGKDQTKKASDIRDNARDEDFKHTPHFINAFPECTSLQTLLTAHSSPIWPPFSSDLQVQWDSLCKLYCTSVYQIKIQKINRNQRQLRQVTMY